MTNFKNILKILTLFICVYLSAFSPLFARMSSETYQITSDVIGSAEGAASSANYNLLVNMGEEGVGVHSSDNWVLKAGFLQTINSTISISVDSPTVNLGNLSPGDSATATTLIGVTTDSMGGYTLSSYFSSVGHTDSLRHSNGTEYITDLTDWDPTANGGDGNAVTWSGSGFGFTIYANNSAEKNTTWWGTGTTVSDANNKYAGFPSSSTKVLETTDYKSGERQTSVGYKVQIPANKLAGTYSGEVTYIATVNL